LGIPRRVLLEMRRSKLELELAREEFQRARAEFKNTLHVWSQEEQRRDIEYDRKLNQSIQRLRDVGKQYVHKALQEAIRNMSDKVRVINLFIW
jgi:hypothetical protein